MDEVVYLIDEPEQIIVELKPLTIEVVVSDIEPQATVTVQEHGAPAIIEIIEDMPFHVQVFEWPACPDVPPDPGIGLPIDATDVLYHNAGYASLSDVQKALDYLLYVPPLITSMSIDVPTQEIGTTVGQVRFSWAFNKTMGAATLTDVGAVNPTAGGYTLSGLNLTSSKSWNLQASDGKNTTSRSVSLQFMNKRHWGTSDRPTLSSSDLLTLSGELSTARSQSRVVDGGGKYLYFAWPAAWGAPTFKVNGLQSTAWIQSILTHTNASGYTSNYVVYRSSTVQYGSGIIVEVT